jgi:hypothetical protein
MQRRVLHPLRGVANENHRADSTNDERLWVVDVGAGQLRLVRGSEALRELIASHGLTKTAPVYLLPVTGTTLGEITEARPAFEGEDEGEPEATKSEAAAEAVHEEPPTVAAAPAVETARAEPPAVAAAPATETTRAEPLAPAAEPAAEASVGQGAKHAGDAEFSLLDRPFDDGEFYEDPPRARWLRGAGIAAVVVVLGGGGYQLLHSRTSVRASDSGHGVASEPVAAQATLAAEPGAAAVVPAAPPVAAPALVPAAPPVAAAPAAAAVAPPAAPAAVPAAPPVAAPAVAAVVPSATPAAAAVIPAAPIAPAPRGVAEPAAAAAAAAPAAERTQAPSPSYSALVAEGKRLFESGHSRRAQALYEQALAETPDGTSALIGLAYVHLDRGKLTQAIALFQRALEQDHDDTSALFGLAESHRQAGDRGAARAEFKQFLTLQPTGADADLARRLVQEL